jgi:ribosomal protein L11 methyltransferase
MLQVEIQNRLALPVLFPNLEIVLTDADESEIKTTLLSPMQWLPNAWQEKHPHFLQDGAPSGEIFKLEIPSALPIDAAGYRVRIFYPQ